MEIEELKLRKIRKIIRKKKRLPASTQDFE